MMMMMMMMMKKRKKKKKIEIGSLAAEQNPFYLWRIAFFFAIEIALEAFFV
jgi:hypothetical protein